MIIRDLLQAVKEAQKVESDYALAKVLDVNKARICAYRAGRETPNEFMCLKIAQATGKSYEEVSAIVRIEAEKDEERRSAWISFYEKITASTLEGRESVGRGRIELPTNGLKVRCSTI